MNKVVVQVAVEIVMVAAVSRKISSLLFIRGNNDNHNTILVYPDDDVVSSYLKLDIFMDVFLKAFHTDKKRNKKIVGKYLGLVYQPPIILSLIEGFSLSLIRENHGDSLYIATNNVANIKRISYNKTRIIFFDGTEVEINCNIRSVNNRFTQANEFWKVYYRSLKTFYKDDEFTKLVTGISKGLVENEEQYD